MANYAFMNATARTCEIEGFGSNTGTGEHFVNFKGAFYCETVA